MTYRESKSRLKRKQQLKRRCILAVTITITAILLIVLISHIASPSNKENDKDNEVTNNHPQDTTPTPEVSNPEDSESDSIDPNGKLIALTYDDGPSVYTSYLLDALEEYNAKATFFIVGNRAEQYRDTIKRMNYLDMEIASHTFGHDLLTALDEAGIKETMDKTDEALTAIIGHGADLMRPVEGSVNDLVQQTVNKPIIRWNVDTLDWQSKDAQAIVNHVLENVHDGCTILMHDIYPTTIEASKILIPKLQELGYQLVTVPELAEARGITLEPGEIYKVFTKTDTSE